MMRHIANVLNRYLPHSIKAGFVLLASLVLCACAGQSRISSEPAIIHSLSPTAIVQVFYTKPDRPYHVITRLRERGVGRSRIQLLTALEKKASALGADAIIVSEHTINHPPGMTYTPGGGQFALQDGQSIHEIDAVAIYFITVATPSSDQ